MFDSEKFILEIKSRPNIWMPANKTSNNIGQKKTSWEEVAQAMFPNWDKYSEKKKKDLVDEMHKKWRNLRDYHNKLKKTDKVINRKASYLNLLEFLDDPMEENRSTRKRSRLDHTDDEDSDDCDGQQSNVSHVPEMYYESKSEIDIESNPFQSSISTNMAITNEDPDKSFLVSILPDIKTMDEKQKFKFKLETLKIIDKIKYQQEEIAGHSRQSDPLHKDKLPVKIETLDESSLEPY